MKLWAVLPCALSLCAAESKPVFDAIYSNDLTSLKKQVTDTQHALDQTQEKNTTLQTEVGELRKKVDDYTKQIQQAKVEKTASAANPVIAQPRATVEAVVIFLPSRNSSSAVSR